jgi:hypothetical protein
MLPESMTASGTPVLASARSTVPWMVGRPRRELAGKFAFVLAAK